MQRILNRKPIQSKAASVNTVAWLARHIIMAKAVIEGAGEMSA